MNPLFQNSNIQPTPMNVAYELLKSSNPIETFNKLAGSNQELQPILQLLRQGVSPQNIFNTLCQQKGIDPTVFINQIRNNMS